MRAAFVALLSLLLLAVPASAVAMFTRATEPVGVTVGTATLSVPRNVTVPATSTGGVAISWTTPVNAPTGTAYYVTRTSGGTTSAACGTDASATISTTSCTDTLSASGSYTYTVTAIYNLWTASATSSTVVASLPVLVFTQNPQNAKSDQSIGVVTVQLRSAAGTNLTTAGVRVSLALSNNSTSGTLAGTTSVTTSGLGVATFTGLNVDNVGSYTLTASATGYTAGFSTTFTISAGPVAAISIVSGNNQSAKTNATFANPLVVSVTDSEGNPVSGANVAFTATPSGGASAAFPGGSTAATTASGQASVSAKANGKKGTYSVTASVGGVASAPFTLTNT